MTSDVTRRRRLAELGRQPAGRRRRRRSPRQRRRGRRARQGRRPATGRRIKPVGSGHSFTAIAVADDRRLDLHRPAWRPRRGRPATIGHACRPACRCTRSTRCSPRTGWRMPNLGDIDAQTVAGAISTGTHGTGAAYGCLSTFVDGADTGHRHRRGRALLGSDERRTCSRPPGRHRRARRPRRGDAALRATRSCCYADERPMPLADVLAGLDEHVAGNDHFEFYWYPVHRPGPAQAQQQGAGRRPAAVAVPRLARRRVPGQHRVRAARAGSAGRCRRWCRRSARSPPGRSPPATYTDRSDRVFCTPRRVRFTEMEYELPRAALPEAFAALPPDRRPAAVQGAVPGRGAVHRPPTTSGSPTGTGATPPTSRSTSTSGVPYEPYFRAFEAVCEPLGGRPHWGKLHYRDAASLRPAYPQLRRLPGRPRPARPGPGLRQRLHSTGSSGA